MRRAYLITWIVAAFASKWSPYLYVSVQNISSSTLVSTSIEWLSNLIFRLTYVFFLIYSVSPNVYIYNACAPIWLLPHIYGSSKFLACGAVLIVIRTTYRLNQNDLANVFQYGIRTTNNYPKLLWYPLFFIDQSQNDIKYNNKINTASFRLLEIIEKSLLELVIELTLSSTDLFPFPIVMIFADTSSYYDTVLHNIYIAFFCIMSSFDWSDMPMPFFHVENSISDWSCLQQRSLAIRNKLDTGLYR